MSSPGKLRLVPSPRACTAALSYARAASSSEVKYPMYRARLVWCGSYSCTTHEDTALPQVTPM
jgi:hypothetical protein